MLYDGFHKVKEVKHPKFEKPFEKIIFKDAVGAVLFTKDFFMPLVSQYRPAADATTLEIPAGLCDKENLSIKEVMFEEFEEEVGIPKELLEKAELIEGSELKSYMLIGSTDATITLFAYILPYTFDELKKKYDYFNPQPDDDVDEVFWVDFKQITEKKSYKSLMSNEMKAFDMKTILYIQHLKLLLESQ